MRAASGEDVVRLTGMLDARRASETRERLHEHIDAGAGAVVVDLSEVEAIDATVMAVLAAASVRLQRAGRLMVLRGCTPTLRRLFAFRGWRRLFVWERDLEPDEAQRATGG